MERMLAALEPVRPEDGFSVIYAGETITLGDILLEVRLREEEKRSYEHCHKAG
jgi:hypothetical protein